MQWRAHYRADFASARPCGLLPAGLWYGEAAQALARNTEFEVPALRRTAARCQQQLVDLGRRGEEARASAVAAAAAYKQARPLPPVLLDTIQSSLPGLRSEL